MAEGPRLRRATPGEAPALASLYVAARRAAEPAIPPAVHSVSEIETYFAEVVLQRHEVWVAVDESGGLVGLLALDGNWVEQLYVHPAETGRGIGTRLLERAKTGRQLLELWTFQANAGARRFYERHGFRAVATTDGDNEEGAPDVRYRWARGTAVQAGAAPE